jgi:hypothetical protein
MWYRVETKKKRKQVRRRNREGREYKREGGRQGY